MQSWEIILCELNSWSRRGLSQSGCWPKRQHSNPVLAQALNDVEGDVTFLAWQNGRIELSCAIQVAARLKRGFVIPSGRSPQYFRFPGTSTNGIFFWNNLHNHYSIFASRKPSVKGTGYHFLAVFNDWSGKGAVIDILCHIQSVFSCIYFFFFSYL